MFCKKSFWQGVPDSAVQELFGLEDIIASSGNHRVTGVVLSYSDGSSKGWCRERNTYGGRVEGCNLIMRGCKVRRCGVYVGLIVIDWSSKGVLMAGERNTSGRRVDEWAGWSNTC